MLIIKNQRTPDKKERDESTYQESSNSKRYKRERDEYKKGTNLCSFIELKNLEQENSVLKL